jgi:hypothetical protein
VYHSKSLLGDNDETNYMYIDLRSLLIVFVAA